MANVSGKPIILDSNIDEKQTINGMQAAGVQACAKHFSKFQRYRPSTVARRVNSRIVGNEQENQRSSINSVIDDRVNHEASTDCQQAKMKRD